MVARTMKDKACYLFGAGEVYSFIGPIAVDEYVIAVDGGYRYTKVQNIAVDMVIGDFDSLGAPPVGENTYILPMQKDDTDMLAAIKIGLAQGCKTFHIYGGAGGRMDHTLANIQCLAYLAQQGAKGYLYDEQFIITLFQNGVLELSARQKGTVSVFCYGEEASGVNIAGLQYPLTNATLTNTFPIGVSNAFIGKTATIAVKQGALLVCWQTAD